MKYLTTLEVAHQLRVSKQTVLNWLRDGRIPEPPRNDRNYRLWSPSRVALVKRMIQQGKLHSRTVIHRRDGGRVDRAAAFAREVDQLLRHAEVDVGAFLAELARINPTVAARLGPQVEPPES
jgi:predicted site-specific integrase-resolvase